MGERGNLPLFANSGNQCNLLINKIIPLLGQALRKLCEYKKIEIVEAKACVDHIHMCLSIPPKYSVSQIVGYLKGKSAIMVFTRFTKHQQNFRGHHFWARGYYVNTVGWNEDDIRKYIRNQEDQDREEDKDKGNPFED